MVRSTGSPAPSTAMPSLHTSPSAWCTAPSAVGAQRDGSSTSPAQTSTSTAAPRGPSPRQSSTRRPPRTRAPRRRARPVARSGPGGAAASTCRAASTSAHPAPRRSGATGGPATSTSSTAHAGAHARTRATHASRGRPSPRVRPTRTTPVPSARSPRPSGGRLGPWRTTSSRRHRTRTGLHRSRRPVPGAGRRRGCAACPRRRPRWPAARPARHRAGTSWRRARGRPARPRWSAA